MLRTSGLWFMLAATSVSALQDQPKGAARIQEMIARLDSDDFAVREQATRELETTGEPALPLLRKALEDGSPEVKERVGRLIRVISASVVLSRPENRELKACWQANEETPRSRHEAVQSWVKNRATTPASIDGLLDLLRVDPDGLAGEAARAALNWRFAPKLAKSVDRHCIGYANGNPRPALEHIEFLCRMTDLSFGATVEGRRRLESAEIPPNDGGSGEPFLEEILSVCGIAGLTCRMDDASGILSFELPSESLAAWSGWWNRIKADRFALMDLGLAPKVDGRTLQASDLDGWIESLASSDPARAKVARSVLKEIPDPLVAQIGMRAGRKGACPGVVEFHERLQLRSKGRILFCSDRDHAAALYVMNLDGSAAQKISGDLKETHQAMVSGGAAYGQAAGAGGEKALYRYDLSGSNPPAKVAAVSGFATLSPDGKRLVVHTREGALVLVDLPAGKTRPLCGPGVEGARWSPDSDRVAWRVQGGCISIFDLGSGKTTSLEAAQPWHGQFAWRPDGKAMACMRRTGEVPGFSQVEVIDTITGRVTAMGGRHEWICEPAWSPDGTKVAFAFHDRDEDKMPPASIEILDARSGTSSILRHPLKVSADTQGKCRWSPDGKQIRYSQMDAPGALIDVATGRSAPAEATLRWGKEVPGLDWLLDHDCNGIYLLRRKGQGRINLTESPWLESGIDFLPPR